MEILGVGPLELFFILIIALIVLGPNDMVKAGRTLGRFLRRLVTSPTWQIVQETSRNLRHLPNKLIREAGIEEDIEQVKQISREMSLDKEAAMLRSLRNPLSVMDEEIKQETQLAAQDFSAWTTPAPAQPAPDSLQVQPVEAVEPTPPANVTGPAEVYSPAPDDDPTQPPIPPRLF